MAPNEDPRRNRDGHPEDNPFVAFRRFADSQVSSLLNTVFTLPATIASFNNAHVAREHCLFGTADKSQCEKLAELENRIASLRSEGRELYRVGDLQKVLQKGEDLMRLDRQADELRRDIIEAGRGTEVEERQRLSRQLGDLQKEIIKELDWIAEGHQPSPNGQERTYPENAAAREDNASRTGRQWSWSWDWSYPKPADQTDDPLKETGDHRWGCRRWQHRRDEIRKQRVQEQADGTSKIVRPISDRDIAEESRDIADGRRPPPEPPFSWPIVAFRPSMSQAELDEWNSLTAFVPVGAHIPWGILNIIQSPSYSPIALEHNEDLKEAGIRWRDAFEDLIRATNEAPLIAQDRLGAYQNLSFENWAHRFQWPPSSELEQALITRRNQRSSANDSEEPNYEYAHDHEDQHDDPPTPKAKQGKWPEGAPDTELDAYERLLGGTHVPEGSDSESRPGILSTLTTTERTVAPDGTVTTKVVLKKRFADGREESSETVHTQRGHDDKDQQQDPWKDMQASQSVSQREQHTENTKKKSWFWSN